MQRTGSAELRCTTPLLVFRTNESRIDLYARLVDKGADVTVRDVFGESPEQIKSAAQTYLQSTSSACETIKSELS